MQRKRTRGYYSDTVELGTHILPVAQMRKITMNKLIKYLVFIVIVYFVYSVYQKISQASKSSVNWNEENDANTNTNNANINDHLQNKEQKVEINKRVKEEINKVFKEFKEKHEKRENVDDKENGNVFKEYREEDIDKAGAEEKNVNAGHGLVQMEENDIFGDNEQGIIIKDDEIEGNDNDDLEQFEDEDDKEKEKEELEIEKEIEERLAEAFKDAINEAAEEVHEQENKAEHLGQSVNADRKDVNVDEDKLDVDHVVQVPEVQQVFKKKEFNLAVNNMGRRLHPLQIQQMNEKARREALKHDSDHEFPPFVTAARQTVVNQVTQLVASIQQFLPGRRIYIYDLDLDKEQKKKLMSYCGVKMRYFMKGIFPAYVSDLDKLHWKPLVLQTALAEFGHVIWINPQFRLGTQELAPLIHESHEQGVLVVGQSAGYSTYSATHPDMLKFIPSDIEKLSYHPHMEIRAIMIHNTPEVHENIMKIFTACALEESCLAPKGAKWQCKFDFTGRKPADCHRFDESALNILLKNWFNFDMAKYARRNNYFRQYDSSYRPKLKICREAKDIRDSEL